MANGPQTPMVLFFLITESMYYLLVISICTFSSIIIITSLPATSVKTKHWNSFAVNISSLLSMLIYYNSTSSVSLVCDLSHNITNSTDLSNNFLFLNDYRIPFL